VTEDAAMTEMADDAADSMELRMLAVGMGVLAVCAVSEDSAD